MRYIIFFVLVQALLMACSTEIKTNRRSHGLAPVSEDLVVKDTVVTSDSIHWDDDKLPTESKPKPEAEKPDPEALDTPIREIPTSIGLRNLDQIRYSMASVTGVSARNAAVATAFEELRTQLPGSNDIKEVSPAKISAVTKLGATFCDIAMRDATLRQAILPAVNFAVPPGQAFADRRGTAQALIDKFWGRNLADLADNAGDVDIVETLIGEISVGLPNNAQSTANIAMGLCTAVLSAAPVLLF